MSNQYPPADFKFPPGFEFADMKTEHAELARKILYFSLFDPDVQRVFDDMTDETYYADMKEQDRLENAGYFDEVHEDPDDDYYDAFGDHHDNSDE